jgi:hypothetical protein
VIGACQLLRPGCLAPCWQECAKLDSHAHAFAMLMQACEAPQGGDYDKLRAHMQQASVEAYHRKAAMIDEHEAGLMQVCMLEQFAACACTHVLAHWPGAWSAGDLAGSC